MFGQIFVDKYVDPSNHIVSLYINGICVPNTFIGKSVDLMFGQIFVDKYVDPSNHIVSIYINGICVPNTLNLEQPLKS
jgi:hypothetical protein